KSRNDERNSEPGTRLQVSSVLRKYVSNDLLCDGLLGRQKQVVHDRIVAVLHWQRIRDVFEAGDVLQSVPKGGYNGIVILLNKVRWRKEVTLRGFDVGPLLP